uniref:Uncharacterized protein n=1 Tax=Anguilla anguilla TaxID=7936 RepID=A0A0E9XWG4_ANGAN
MLFVLNNCSQAELISSVQHSKAKMFLKQFHINMLTYIF